jgi:uncharacterized protein (PEP-CTERM system associated)
MQAKKKTKKNSDRSIGFFLQRSALAAGAFAIGLFSIEVSASVEFHPNALLSATWTDNISLLSDNDPNKESAFVIQFNPGFTWVQKAQRFDSSVTYTMQNVFYLGNLDTTSTHHQASAAANAELLKDYFFLSGNGSYSQQVIDPRLPTNTANLFATNNQADALTGSLTPSLRHDFGDVHVDARYSRGVVDYKSNHGGGTLQDARTESRDLLFATVDQNAGVTWSARYDSQLVKYELSIPFRYDRAEGELGFLLGQGFRLVGRGGRETNPAINPSEGGFDGTTWDAGFQWSAGKRSSAEAFYGKRFYGTAYSGHIKHEARRVHFDVSYDEAPTTQAQELSALPTGVNPVELGAVTPGTNYFSRLTSDVYLRKSLRANVAIIGNRTEIDLGAADYRRQYLHGPAVVAVADEHTRNASASMIRTLSERDKLTFSGSYANSELVDGEKFSDLNIRVEMSRQLTRHLQLAFATFRLRRTGNSDYIANGATISLNGQL